jgi:N-methylhydantoinase A/oxoprolinase/acetone carboxylase beta subunit
VTTRLGFDIGGTFTDFALFDEATASIQIGKRLTTYPDPSVGALAGLSEMMADFESSVSEIVHAVHGTTVASNAIIERKGAPTALLTTKGFRDVLEIRRSKRHSLYDLQLAKARPLVPRELRFGIEERLLADGTVFKDLDEDGLAAVAQELIDRGVSSIAVCFLHSYVDPTHELRAFQVLKELLGSSVEITLSHGVSRRIREYERTSTTVASAYIAPVVRHYLTSLETGLRSAGLRGDLHIMQSNGGIATARTATTYPIRIVESGPAAGALIAAVYGEMADCPNVLSFDMGGTTAKLCVIEDGRPQFTHELEIDRHLLEMGSGIPLNIEAIELVEIGAGGGSIASVQDGILKVGPESAGADPAPICYGKGGTKPTVTDANLVLGYLNADYFLGGRMPLDVSGATNGLLRDIAGPLGIGVAAAAWGVYRVVTANMEAAAREVTIQKGRDPRDFAIVAFGGAGPLHAAELAVSLGVPRVLIPPGAGVTSAVGLLAAKPKFNLVRSFITGLEAEEDLHELNRLFAEMEAEALDVLRDAGAGENHVAERSVHMRYVGQGYDLEVPVPSGDLGRGALSEIRRTFDAVYRRSYGTADEAARVSASDWYVSITGTWRELQLGNDGLGGDPTLSGGSQPPRRRSVYSPHLRRSEEWPVFLRAMLPSKMTGVGPAIIEERESTTVVPAGWQWSVTSNGSLILDHTGTSDV